MKTSRSWPLAMIFVSLLLLSGVVGSQEEHPVEPLVLVDFDKCREQVTLLEQSLASEDDDVFPCADLVEHLKTLPPCHELRLEAIIIARQFANPKELTKRFPEKHSRNHWRLHIAWKLLMDLGVLRKGMPFEDLVAIVGRPSEPWRAKCMDWYYPSIMHVNPSLRVWYSSETKTVGAIEVIGR